jgi:hypothetical protein
VCGLPRAHHRAHRSRPAARRPGSCRWSRARSVRTAGAGLSLEASRRLVACQLRGVVANLKSRPASRTREVPHAQDQAQRHPELPLHVSARGAMHSRIGKIGAKARWSAAAVTASELNK